jgi:myosin heavy subunit
VPISGAEDGGQWAAELREARGALEREQEETRKAMGLAKQEEAARKRAEAAVTNVQQMVQEEAKARSKAETELQKAVSALKVAQEKATADAAELQRVKNDLATETKLRRLAEVSAKSEQEKAEADLKRLQEMQALLAEARRSAENRPERVEAKKLERLTPPPLPPDSCQNGSSHPAVKLVCEYYADLNRRDAKAALEKWDPSAEQLKPLQRELPRNLEGLKGFPVTRVALVSSDLSSATVEADATEEKPNKSVDWFVKIDLRHDGQGWKILSLKRR